MPNQTTNNQPLSPWRKWGTVVVLSLALAIIIIDSTLLNVSFAYLVRDLKTDLQSLQWVITAYSLTLAALTITGGRLGDFYGRKKMFLLGAVIFAVGSFIASESHTVGTMIIGESIIEGIGAALMMPATSSLLVSTFRGRERAVAMGIWGGIAAASSAVGPILGGYLTTNYSWRWGFRINVFVALLLLLGSFLVKEYKDEEEKPRLDGWGVVLSSLGLLSLVFGVIESSRYGWWQAKEAFMVWGHQIGFDGLSISPVAITLGLAILAVFGWWQKRIESRGDTPLVSLALLSNQQFSSGVITTMIMSVGQAGLFFSIPIFFQAVRGLDAYHTGLALLPVSLTALFAAPLSAFLTKYISPKYLIQFALLSNIVGFLIMRSEMNPAASAHDLIPGLIFFGFGIGLVMAQLNNLTMSAISPQEAGEAAGVNNTMRQLGTSLGSAIIGTILITAVSSNLTAGVQASTIIPSPMKSQIASAVSTQTSNIEFGGGAQLPSRVTPAIATEITTIGHQATTDANRLALVYAAFFSFLGLIASFWLPAYRDIEHNERSARIS